MSTRWEARAAPLRRHRGLGGEDQRDLQPVDPQLGDTSRRCARRSCSIWTTARTKRRAATALLRGHPPPVHLHERVGLHDDVQTLLHEGGHSFHGFEISALPLSQQRRRRCAGGVRRGRLDGHGTPRLALSHPEVRAASTAKPRPPAPASSIWKAICCSGRTWR